MPFYYELVGFIETVNGALKEGDRQSGTGMRGSNDSGVHAYEEMLLPYLARVSQESYSVEYGVRGFALGYIS